MKLISREFSIQKLYIGPIPSIPVIQCTKLTASSPSPHLPLREYTGMFVVLALLYIYFLSLQVLTATFNLMQGEAPWMYIILPSFHLYLQIHPVHHLSSLPLFMWLFVV